MTRQRGMKNMYNELSLVSLAFVARDEKSDSQLVKDTEDDGSEPERVEVVLSLFCRIRPTKNGALIR